MNLKETIKEAISNTNRATEYDFKILNSDTSILIHLPSTKVLAYFSDKLPNYISITTDTNQTISYSNIEYIELQDDILDLVVNKDCLYIFAMNYTTNLICTFDY